MEQPAKSKQHTKKCIRDSILNFISQIWGTHLNMLFKRCLHQPTVYALSTRPGRAAIAVVRVLGSQAKFVYQQLTGSRTTPTSRKTSVRRLFLDKGMLDEALTVFFQAPKTYTGEDLLELHVHGGTAIVSSVLKAIQKLHDPENGVNIRYAEHGEFSKRAFMNGRFDLTEIEGIREMIDAETETQRLAALASLTGESKRVFAEWRHQLVQNVALLTTVIDFGEEHNLEETEQLFGDVERNIDALLLEIESYLRKVRGSEVLLRGIKLSLLGPPNAGKSSMLNYLANSETAIVSEIAGTTRDVIDVPLDIGGYKVIVGDTAGIRPVETADAIEIEGMKRAKQRALVGDMVLAVVPVDQPLSSDIKEHLQLLKDANREISVVVNKLDLLKGKDSASFVQGLSDELAISQDNIFVVSCINGEGMDHLQKSLTTQFKRLSMSENSDPVVISARAQDLLENDVLYGLKQFKIWKENDDVLLAAECLRQSVDGIGKITGDAVGLDEILDVVFSSFCIGK